MDEKIIIQQHTPKWFMDYIQEEIKIRRVLGVTLIEIEHIGSTSVENLGSKPIIDIMCGVFNLDEIDRFITSFKEIGYEFVWHEEFPERRFFRKGKRRAGTHHLHIYEYESENWKNNILFRDYLKNNARIRQEYYELKCKLAEKFPHDRVAYTNGKNEFIKNVIEKVQSELK